MLEALQEQETVQARLHPVMLVLPLLLSKNGAYLSYIFPKGSINARTAVRCIDLLICSLPPILTRAEALNLHFFEK